MSKKTKTTYDVKLSAEIEPFDFTVTSCGVDYNSCKKSVNPPIANYSIFALFNGKGVYILNGKTFPISTYDVCLIPNGIEYTTIPDKGEVFQHYHTGFSGPNINYFLDKVGLSIDHPVISTGSLAVKNKMEKIYKLLSKNTFVDTFRANMIFIDILYYLIIIAKRNSPLKIMQKNDFVQQVSDYINQYYMYDIKINDIAEKMHINRSYLSHLFSTTKGVSIKEYLIERRMEVAKQLLFNTNKPISEISTLSGFPDTVSFYRQFKKQTSMSPQQYKTKLKIDPRFRTIKKF